jgi:hypothetical protein
MRSHRISDEAPCSRRNCALVVAILGFAVSALASEPHEKETESHHRHHAAIFLGGAVRDEGHTESGFTGGVEYEYRFAPFVGAGILAEAATGDLREVLMVAPLALYPWRGLRLVAAPGAELPGEGETEFVMRLGVGYRFPIGRFMIIPEFNADLIEGTPTYVIGVGLGMGF